MHAKTKNNLCAVESTKWSAKQMKKRTFPMSPWIQIFSDALLPVYCYLSLVTRISVQNCIFPFACESSFDCHFGWLACTERKIKSAWLRHMRLKLCIINYCNKLPETSKEICLIITTGLLMLAYSKKKYKKHSRSLSN